MDLKAQEETMRRTVLIELIAYAAVLLAVLLLALAPCFQASYRIQSESDVFRYFGNSAGSSVSSLEDLDKLLEKMLRDPTIRVDFSILDDGKVCLDYMDEFGYILMGILIVASLILAVCIVVETVNKGLAYWRLYRTGSVEELYEDMQDKTPFLSAKTCINGVVCLVVLFFCPRMFDAVNMNMSHFSGLTFFGVLAIVLLIAGPIAFLYVAGNNKVRVKKAVRRTEQPAPTPAAPAPVPESPVPAPAPAAPVPDTETVEVPPAVPDADDVRPVEEKEQENG